MISATECAVNDDTGTSISRMKPGLDATESDSKCTFNQDVESSIPSDSSESEEPENKDDSSPCSNDSIDDSSWNKDQILQFVVMYLCCLNQPDERHAQNASIRPQAEKVLSQVEANCSVNVLLEVSLEHIIVSDEKTGETILDCHFNKVVCLASNKTDVFTIVAAIPNVQGKLHFHFFNSPQADYITSKMKKAWKIYRVRQKQKKIMDDQIGLLAKVKEIQISKDVGEPLGVVLVASGWGSILPTPVLAHMDPVGRAARCKNLSIGTRILAVNDRSLVCLDLKKCESIVSSCKNKSSVKLNVIDYPRTTVTLIYRPSRKYALDITLENGVIIDFKWAGLAERSGLRIYHKILEINGKNVVHSSNQEIEEILSNAVGKIHFLTMSSKMFLLTNGIETPHYI